MRQWLIDAFTDRPFGGNPAWVCEPFATWPDAGWMQAVAMENHVGATAFLTRTAAADRFGLRWFTPATEVPLCGHATLAAAHLLTTELGLTGPLGFETRSGLLEVAPGEGGGELSLPAFPSQAIETPAGLAEALGAEPIQVWRGYYLVALLDSAVTVRRLAPRTDRLEAISRALGGQGNVGVAALDGGEADVVDRFFAPGYGLPEDPATGSFHAQLAPLMARRLDGGAARYYQAFPGRGAVLTARLDGDRVRLTGGAVTVAEARLRLAVPTAA